MMKPQIEAFFDPSTFTYSYVVTDGTSGAAAVIDPVLDYDAVSGRTSTESADRILDYLARGDLRVEWILETHVHADHLSAATYLKEKVGGRMALGRNVIKVQDVFGRYFNAGAEFPCTGEQFDVLFDDEQTFTVGSLEVQVLATPGHTPACVTYVIDGAAFVGDTLFMPDYGTARTDFPGGDAHQLYRSIQRIFALPLTTRLYMCHDYGSEIRTEFRNETTVAEEREENIHIHDGIDEESYVTTRNCRDAKLRAPKLLLPSVQFNMRGGRLPPAEENGVSYFKIPVTAN